MNFLFNGWTWLYPPVRSGMLMTFGFRCARRTIRQGYFSPGAMQTAAKRFFDLLFDIGFRTPVGWPGAGFGHRHGYGPLGNARVLILFWLGFCRSMTGGFLPEFSNCASAVVAKCFELLFFWC